MLPTMYSHTNNGWFPSIFNDFFNDAWMPTKITGSTPAINVTEDDKEYKIEVAAPGMNKDDFKVNVKNGELFIEMEKKTEDSADDKDNKKYLRHEFSYSRFEQSMTLPDNVEQDNITAGMDNGVLTIEIPKMTEEEKAQEMRCIEIK